jgi:short-subunit dehydrogenase
MSPSQKAESPAKQSVVGVNLIGVLHTLTLVRRSMHTHEVKEGSVVISISTVAYAPEQSLPVYMTTKFALVGLVRSLRSTILSQEESRSTASRRRQ